MESEEHIKNIEDLRESSIENNEDKGKNQEPGAYVINININVFKRSIDKMLFMLLIVMS